MPLEDADFISELNPAWPLGSDNINEGDDHDRVTKKALQQSWPNIDAACTPTPDQINSWEARIAALEGVEITETTFLNQSSVPLVTGVAGLYRVEIYFNELTTNDNNVGHGFRLEQAGVPSLSNYQSSTIRVNDGGTPAGENKTNQLPVFFAAAPTDHRGFVRFDLQNGPGNIWTVSGNLARANNPTLTLIGGVWQGGGVPADGLQLRATDTISGVFGGRYWAR